MSGAEAASLAANVVTFIDFGSKLISRLKRLYNSNDGMLAEHRDLERTTIQLRRLNDDLKLDAVSNGDDGFCQLYHDCSKTAEELLSVLDKLKVEGTRTKFKTFRKALESFWKKEAIQDLEQRLERFQQIAHQYQAHETDRHVRQLTKQMSDLSLGQEQDTSLREDRKQDKKLDKLLSSLPNVPQAAFDSWERQDDALCLENTRVDLLRQIRAWSEKPNSESVYWLWGLAGTGKSAIARTVARTASKANSLAASFFFSRGGGDFSHARKFVPTVAHQMASKYDLLKPHICEASKDIANKSLADQWHELILHPMASLNKDSPARPKILVIDALDECDRKEIAQMIKILADLRSLRHGQLRVFLTSRREVSVYNGLQCLPDDGHQSLVFNDIKSFNVDHDIALFFRYKFSFIRKTQSGLAENWPGPKAISRLVQKACGLFIWAETVCEYIKVNPKKRLNDLLHKDDAFAKPEQALDKIYLLVLDSSICPEYHKDEMLEVSKNLSEILASLALLYSPLSTAGFSKLLGRSAGDIEDHLGHLRAIVDGLEQPDRPLRIHHTSLREFLLDKKRCSDERFQADRRETHRFLADRCIQLMSKHLHRNMSGLASPDAQVDTLTDGQIDQALSPELRYACEYWVQHLECGEDLCKDGGQVHAFLQNHLLHWFEALSLIQILPKAFSMISLLEKLIAVSAVPLKTCTITD